MTASKQDTREGSAAGYPQASRIPARGRFILPRRRGPYHIRGTFWPQEAAGYPQASRLPAHQDTREGYPYHIRGTFWPQEGRWKKITRLHPGCLSVPSVESA